MTLPLTKTLDPADFLLLPKELAIVDEHFTGSTEQHPMRRWEYALALDAVSRWTRARKPWIAYDVGGAGSPFYFMLGDLIGRHVTIIDPAYEVAPITLETFVTLDNPQLAEVVTCLSVLEHVDDLDRFLYHLGCLVAPGGLLFLTVDCCNGDAPDPDGWPIDRYHFHWMRRQIFNQRRWQRVRASFNRYQFDLFGDADWTYHGDHVYDYSFASLALQKRA